MALLSEFALTPDVLDSSCYTTSEVGEIYCKILKKALLEEDGLIRNLRDETWSNLFFQPPRAWHPKWKELVKKLKKQNRLIKSPTMGGPEPACDDDWCNEALRSDAHTPLVGVIANRDVASRFAAIPKVASIADLETKDWWTSRSPSLRLQRNLAEYSKALSLFLRHARSVMFIDAHLDPSQLRYQDFVRLLQGAANREPSPVIEVHRVTYKGSGPSRRLKSKADWEAVFRTNMEPSLRTNGPAVEVFIWDDFHDRHIVSDLAGIHLGNGLDTTTAAAMTTWTRLGRDARDDIQREFDPGSREHLLLHRFKIP